MTRFYDIEAITIEGESIKLGEYSGKVLLIVNVASKCGFTPQYAGLETLYRKYAAQGFVILGFPCNQFGQQEPGTEQEIAKFCDLNYNVTFPMFSKLDVNGERTHPLFAILKEQAPGLLGTLAIKWNFTKFLVDRRGRVLKRFAPSDAPQAIDAEVAAALA